MGPDQVVAIYAPVLQRYMFGQLPEADEPG